MSEYEGLLFPFYLKNLKVIRAAWVSKKFQEWSSSDNKRDVRDNFDVLDSIIKYNFFWYFSRCVMNVSFSLMACCHCPWWSLVVSRNSGQNTRSSDVRLGEYQVTDTFAIGLSGDSRSFTDNSRSLLWEWARWFEDTYSVMKRMSGLGSIVISGLIFT